jgi:hypothetical protein
LQWTVFGRVDVLARYGRTPTLVAYGVHVHRRGGMLLLIPITNQLEEWENGD